MRIDVQTEAISQDLISEVVHASRNTHRTLVSAILLLDFCTVDDERKEVLSLFDFYSTTLTEKTTRVLQQKLQFCHLSQVES